MDDYTKYNNQINDLLSKRPAEEQSVISNIQNKYGLQEKQNTLQDIRKNVMSTEKLLNELPQQLQQRTAGNLMTSGQLSRLQAVEQDPIIKQVSELNKRQAVGQTDLDMVNQLVNTDVNREQSSWKDRLAEIQRQRDLSFQAVEAAKAAQRAKATTQGQWDFLKNFNQSPTQTTDQAPTLAQISAAAGEIANKVKPSYQSPTPNQNKVNQEIKIGAGNMSGSIPIGLFSDPSFANDFRSSFGWLDPAQQLKNLLGIK